MIVDMSVTMNNWIRKIEEKFKPWMMIVVFIILLVIGFANEAKADVDKTGVQIELGGGFLSGQYSKAGAIAVQQRFDNKFSIGMGYISEQWVIPRREPKTWVQENLWVQAQRHVGLQVGGNWDFGIGIAYFNSTNRALGSHFTAALSLEYNFNRKWNVKLRHFSNAGSARPNMGQDMLMIGYRFGG